MTVSIVPETCLRIDGTTSRDAAISEVEQWLHDVKGLDEWEIGELNIPGNIRLAWWGGDVIGFCNANHENAQQVVVVGVPAHILES